MKKKLTTGKLLKKLQVVFNAYIRERDKDKPCISCGNYFEKKDAGHYFATSGYSGLRFDEDNVHGECAGCNRFNDSHLIGYGLTLPFRIGEYDYKALLLKADEYKRDGIKWNRNELEEKIEYYKQKIKDYQ